MYFSGAELAKHAQGLGSIPAPKKKRQKKILNQIPAHQIQQFIERILHRDQVRCVQGKRGCYTTLCMQHTFH
jgi:hypothetical protein